MKYYSYEDFKNDTNKLITQVKPLEVDAIIGIARGGLALAHCMSEGLDIRNVQSLRTELYDDTQKRETITIHNSCKLDGVKKVLVVDDISDSGDTLDAVMKDLKQKYIDIEFLSATLFYKKTSIHKPDFWIKEATEWIEFFWERDFL
ncbi:MAG: phosphoribosyltransferase family protein [Campylobacterota bacterium]|nr:phosphoribosyltransferase family protein [Campylobacterota bacterium]